MTTINTTDDLLALLRENEEFREAVRQAVLTEELIALPAMFNAFVAEMRDFVSEMRAYIKTTDERLAKLEERMAGLEERVAGLEERVLRLEERMLELEKRMVRLEERQTNLEEGQQRHTLDIGMLKGFALETKLYNRGVALIATLLRVYSGRRIRVAEVDDNSAEFNSAIYQALENGVLTEAEYDRILDTDMIVSGRRKGVPGLVYTAIEASYTVSRADIYKVNETASILDKVLSDVEIHAALYCVNVLAAIEDEASEQGVHLIRTRVPVG